MDEKSQVKKYSIGRFFAEYGIVVVLIALLALFSSLSDKFFDIDNILNILRQVALVGLRKLEAR